MFSRVLPLLLMATSFPGLAGAQTAAADYVIRNVNVIPMTAAGDVGARDVVIRGRRIERVAAARSVTPGAGTTVIDGTGRYLVPGLIDSHVHIKQEDPLFLFVAAGVTTVQNMAGAPFHLEMRERTNRGVVLGPRIITTGPTTAQAGVGTPAEFEQLVRDQKRLGYNAIKMYGSSTGPMSMEAYRALAGAAREEGLRVVGHAARDLPFQAVLDVGQNSIDHMEEVVYTHRPFARLLQPYVDLQFGRASAQLRDSLQRARIPDFAGGLRKEIAGLAADVKRSGLALTPNLIFFRNIYWMTHDSIHALLRAPELAYSSPVQRINWSPSLNRYHNAWGGNMAVISPYLGEVVRLQYALTLAFHRAGVPLMTGTDSEYLGTTPGFAVHDELAQFVAAGLTPHEALRAATAVPARVLEIADSVGTIEAGKVADLLLLDANPLADIAHTRRIHGVLRAGRWLARAELDALRDSLARSHEPLHASLSAFMTALEQRGPAAALAAYRASAQQARIAKSVENVINSYGYRVLGAGRTKEAIEVFRLNAETFPTEHNTWDSLAEGYMVDGQKDLAIKYYRKTLELQPDSDNAKRMLKQLGAPVPDN